MEFIRKYHLFIFFSVWTLINVIQAANTVLLNDEAYYWVYSNFLDWGYFDHPPMIAALIKAGYYLFKSELGVRLFMVILNTLTLVIIFHLLPRKKNILFYAISCSIAVIQFGGFIAVPDIPLVFFVALFFLVYKNFVGSYSWPNTILMGFVMALVMYSKYHGILIIIFTIISNPALLKTSKAYVAVFVSIMLYVPHLYWQYQHGFPSVQYHLFERNSPYQFSYTSEYILSQVLLAGPFMGWLLIPGALKYQPKDLFERALKFSLAGIYLFFFLSTFRGHIEANWTVPVIIPLMILSHQYLYDHRKWQRILMYTVPLSLLVILFARFYIITDNKFIKRINTSQFQQDKAWAGKITDFSGGLPVVFISSYQKASRYWFYSGIPAFSLNTPDYRRNNYNYWPVENSIQHKSVYAVVNGSLSYFIDSIPTTTGPLHGRRVNDFYSHSDIQLEAIGRITFDKDKYAMVTVQIKNEAAMPVNSSLQFHIYVFKKDKLIISYKLLQNFTDPSQKSYELRSHVPVLLPTGAYSARLGISSAITGFPSLNGTDLNFAMD